MSRIGFFIAMLVLFSSGSGCGLRHYVVPCCGDCGKGSCGLASCTNGCGVASDPILGDYTKCGVCGGSNCPGFTPLGYLKYKLTCGSGCGGQLYYGEWTSDPPACCDPCDNCGNYTGPDCYGRGRPIGPLLRTLWGGYPYYGGCCGDSCCGNSCGSPGGYGGGYTGGYNPGYAGNGRLMSRGPRMTDGPRQPAADEVDLAPETVEPGGTAPQPAAPNSMQPKAARPTEAKRASYQQRPAVPMRPGMYRGNPQAQPYNAGQQYPQTPQNSQQRRAPQNPQYVAER